MQSIVLTFDRQLEVANLVVESYNRLWPGCPLVFRIPYQERPVSDLFRASNICFVKTPVAIRATMEHLLQGCADDEFVYWCVDDRFPVRILDPDTLHVAYDVRCPRAASPSTPFEWARLSRTAIEQGAQDETRPLVIGKARFFPQRANMQLGFYMPQFIRARVLREYFLHSDLPVDYGIRDFHDWLEGQCVRHRIYAPERVRDPARRIDEPRRVDFELSRADRGDGIAERRTCRCGTAIVSYGGEFEPFLGLS